MAPEQIIAQIRATAAAAEGVQVQDFFNGKEVLVIFRGKQGDRRSAAVRTPGSRWFTVEIEDSFDKSFVDEDANESEVREHLDACTRIALAYIQDGGVQQRRGLLRSRSVVIYVSGTPVRVQKKLGWPRWRCF